MQTYIEDKRTALLWCNMIVIKFVIVYYFVHSSVARVSFHIRVLTRIKQT